MQGFVCAILGNTKQRTTIMHLVWLRNDLRLEDNPALYHAALQGDICCVYTATPEQWRIHGDAPIKIRLWRERLISLQVEFEKKNIPLKLLWQPTYTDIPDALLELASRINAKRLYYNIEYPLNEKRRDECVNTLFAQHSLSVECFHGDVVMPPGTVKTQKDEIYKVFTPFSRQWHKQASDQQLHIFPTPRKQKSLPLPSDNIEKIWPIDQYTEAKNNSDLWLTESKKIHQRMGHFCTNAVVNYKTTRDIPSDNGTSTLSPFLAAGMISTRQCIASARKNIDDWRSNQWVTELIWREFYRHLLDHYPHLSQSKNFIHLSKKIPWENNEQFFIAWCEGKTGFPIVDAAMKQLLQTGWMHNRLRMITAAFLTKILLIDWRKGEAFFMQHLLDGDYASNNGGWQWSASTGADAVPYFRIFNPQRQSERFDKNGIFIKQQLPELASLNNKSIHNPSDQQRIECGYPRPIIDYTWARQRALEQYSKAMGKNK